MQSEFYEITCDGSWQTIEAAGMKTTFVKLEIESLSTNGNAVLVRRKEGGVTRSLNPGDIDRIEVSANWNKELVNDGGIAVQGTSGDVVKVEQTTANYQGA